MLNKSVAIKNIFLKIFGETHAPDASTKQFANANSEIIIDKNSNINY